MTISTNIFQNKSKQDFILSGKTKKFEFIVVADGHGFSTTINIIRNVDWFYLLTLENIEEEIYNLFSGTNTQNSGSTISIIKIFPKYFEFFWIGDSKIILLERNKKKIIFQSLNHDFQNKKEVERIKPFVKKIQEKYSPTILSLDCTTEDLKKYNLHETTPRKKIDGIITMEKNSAYFSFSSLDKISMTHSLGHNNLTGKFLSYKKMLRKKNDEYKIIVGSDGLWDIIFL